MWDAMFCFFKSDVLYYNYAFNTEENLVTSLLLMKMLVIFVTRGLLASLFTFILLQKTIWIALILYVELLS